MDNDEDEYKKLFQEGKKTIDLGIYQNHCFFNQSFT